MQTPINSFFTALGFLTTYPTKVTCEPTSEDLGQSAAFFPLIGVCIGFFLLAIYTLGSHIFPNSIVTIILLVSLMALTRGLHLDGFADVIDGFFGAYSKKDRVKIMKDSSIGVFAVCGLIFLLLTKFISLNNLSASTKIDVLFVMPMMGRLSIVFIAFISNYTDSHEGIGKPFLDYIKEREFWTATITATIFAILFMGGDGILIVFSILTFSILFSKYSKNKIGGVTGDVLGATCELSEVMTLIIANMLEGNLNDQLFQGIWL